MKFPTYAKLKKLSILKIKILDFYFKYLNLNNEINNENKHYSFLIR